ncbi:MAG: hypothetical protein JOZ24_00505 [Candidatus Eremiobacteraeota bacterium]|nr:hypothetical protein [Candidatus Eremiobacteraeota bacterium]
MRSRRAVLLAAVLFAPIARPAAADEADVRGRIAGAMRAARSFVVTTTASTGFTVMTTVVAPDRLDATLTYQGATQEYIVIGSTSYVGVGGAYRRAQTPPEIVAAQSHLRDIPIDRFLPDGKIGTKTWGRFETTVIGPQKEQHLTCTYDKVTFRIGRCQNEGLQISFARYDDPLNHVDAPSHLSAEGTH